mgnify:CR=1 FL=1
MFSRFRMPALPVDSHHHRVAQRLGIIPDTLAVGPSHAVLSAMLPEDWGAREVYEFWGGFSGPVCLGKSERDRFRRAV